MASRRGMTLRNEQAEARIDAALTALAEGSGLDLPAAPARVRDPFRNDSLRLEWMADVLEVLAASGGIADLDVMTRPELNDLAERLGVEHPGSLQNKGEVIDAIEAVRSAESEGPPVESDQVDTDVTQEPATIPAPEGEPGNPADGEPIVPEDPEGVEPPSFDREALKEHKLDDLKAVAIENGADAEAVAKMRAKDDVIDVLASRVETGDVDHVDDETREDS